jgi:hypothetical protein
MEIEQHPARGDADGDRHRGGDHDVSRRAP